MSTVDAEFRSRVLVSDPQYWARNLASPVRFNIAVQTLLDTVSSNTSILFLEIGPHFALAAPLKQICESAGRPMNYIAAQTRNKDAFVSFLIATGKLWQASVLSDLSSLFIRGQCISGLPRYQWDDGRLPKISEDMNDSNFAALSVTEKRERILRMAQQDSSELLQDVKPEIRMEILLRYLWMRTLYPIAEVGAEKISPEDNFFLLGGDSLAAIELSTLANDIGIRLVPQDVLSNPTFAAMSSVASIAESEAGKEEIEPFALLPHDRLVSLTEQVRKKCNLSSEQTIEDIYPCTSLQEGFMALGMKQAGSYIHRQVYKLNKNVNLDRFKVAWDVTMERCGSLRSRIVMVGERTLQAVIKENDPWEQPDSRLDVYAYVNSTRSIPMLYGDRLSRYTIMRHADGSNFLVWLLHHAIFDGLTMKIVLDAVYDAYNGNDAMQLRPYSNFIRYIKSLDSAKSRSYWDTELSGAAKAAFPSGQITDRSKDLGRVMKRTIHCRNNGVGNSHVTIAAILRAAWAIVLGKYCETEDVCFGTTVSGRQAPVPGLNQVAGPMISTVPVRIRLEPGQTVTSFLHKVQSQATSLVAHEQYGLQNISKLSPDAHEACDFSNLLVIQPMQALSSVAETASDRIIYQGDAEKALSEEAMRNYFNYPLVLQARIREQEVELDLTYYSDIVSETRLESLCHHFDHVVQQLLEPSDTLLGDVSVSTAWDLEYAAKANNEIPTIVSSCIHDLVSDQARRRPHAPAIHAWDKRLTYRELDAASDRLSHHIMRKYGVKRHDLVHVCFEKSAWFFVAILAINKAGAAWVPLDPSHPEQRQRQVVSQTKASVILSSSSNMTLASSLVRRALEVTEDLDKKLMKTEPMAAGLRVMVSPNDIAYVLFTSGSTGTPKGLVMEHQSVCTSQTAIARRLNMTQDVRMLQFASFVFDLSIGEIIGPWVAGGCLCIPSEESRMNDLPSFIRSSEVTWAYLTPSFARTLDPALVPGLQLLLFAGEAVGKDVFDKWFGKVRLVNGWGPAETCCFSTLWEWTSKEQSPLTIGRPVGGLCWIVDTENPSKLAPIGTFGEVLIQGPTVLREYLADVEKTKLSTLQMLPEWASQSPMNGQRIFKSGDLCRYNSDGTIEFGARKDKQIKIRGLRVELGEVEHHIRSSLGGVKQVAVDMITINTSPNLVAYFSFAEETRSPSNVEDALFEPMTADIQSKITTMLGELKVVLPRYMVPTLFFPCRYMPFITSTKLDLKLLKERTLSLGKEDLASYALLDSNKRSPETEMERRMQALWATQLKLDIESIGLDDSFLHLGGDSIAAIYFVSAAREAGISLTVKDIFDDPRLFKVSSAAVALHNNGDTDDVVEPLSLLAAQHVDFVKSTPGRQRFGLSDHHIVEDAYPCTSLQEGLMALTAKNKGSYVSTYVHRIPKHIDLGRFQEAWNIAVRKCTNMRTRIIVEGASAIQAVIRNDDDWENTEGMNLSSFLVKVRDFDVGYGTRLCRYALLHESDQTYLIWVIHHAVNDGWSMRIVLDTVYRSYHNQDLGPISPYVNIIKYVVTGFNDGRAAAYWKAELEGAMQPSFPPRMTRSSGTKRLVRVVDKEVPFCRARDPSITMATILRTAWALVLARYGDSTDVTYGATISGRQAPVRGILTTPGAVIATVPIRVQIRPDIPVAELLREVQLQASKMVPYEQYGLSNIARVSSSAREACDCTSLLVIQPKEQTSSIFNLDDGLLMSGDEEDYFLVESLNNYFNYPLVMLSYMSTEHVKQRFLFNPDLLSNLQVEAIAEHFDFVVQQLLDTGDRLVGDVSLIGDWDYEQALSASKLRSPTISCTHDLISKHISDRPNELAVSSWDGDFTYAEVGAFASHLALALQDLGVGPEAIVPIVFPKTKWVVITMVAIQMAGGAFAPLDPSAPLVRINAMVADTNAKLVIAGEPRLLDKVVHLNIKTLLVDELWFKESPSLLNTRRFKSQVTPQNASVVLFTSGSTGKPKGMILDHSAMCSTSDGYGASCAIGPGSRVFNFSAFTWDVAILDILVSLMRGACVCMPSDHDRMNNLATSMNALRADFVFLTPTVADMLVPDELPHLKTVCFGGEAVTRNCLDRWRHTDKQLIGGYGPVEASCCGVNPDLRRPNTSASNIGYPTCTAFWVTEPHDPSRLIPIGCVGELLIQGPTLARGYFNVDPKAASSWLEEIDYEWLPYGKTNRAYRTGDLVRRCADGTFDYIGRKDTQVKINGQRVELGDIESNILSSLPKVQQVAANVLQIDGMATVVGFLCFSEETKSSQDVVSDDMFVPLTTPTRRRLVELSSQLSVRLPQYMVPSLFITTKYMPLNTSAKLDRKTLATLAVNLDPEKLSGYSLASEIGGSPPVTAMETCMQGIWSEILRTPPENIRCESSFLQLGGDSITAIYVVTAARQKGISLFVQDIFDDPRLSQVALKARSLNDANSAASNSIEPFGLLDHTQREWVVSKAPRYLCDLEPDQDIEDAYPCTSLTEGLMALSVKQPGSYVMTYAYQLSDSADLGRFQTAWEKTVNICGNLRTRIVLLKGVPIQVIVKGPVTWDEPGSTSLRGFFDLPIQHSFSYGKALSRYTILVDAGQTYFLWTVHHSVYDGWSMRVMLDTFQRLYSDLELKSLPQYSKFIKYTLDTDQEEVVEFWSSKLEGATRASFPPKLDLPETPQSAMRLHAYNIPLPSQSQESITKATILRAAWGILLARYSDSKDICFAATSSGRQTQLEGVELMPGPTIATVPFRLRLDQKQTISKFLLSIQNQALEMVPFEQMGLQNISRISPEARAACESSSLLVIQPPARASTEGVLSHGELEQKLSLDSMQSYVGFSLVAIVSLGDESLNLRLFYDSAILSEAHIEAMAHAFDHVVQQLMTQDENLLLSSVSLVGDWDVQHAIASCQLKESTNSCSHWLIQEQILQRPYDQAVVSWDGNLTYKKLGMFASRLAALLQELGVESEVLVPLCFPKSTWAVVAMVAVQLAGGAFVPLDPSAARARLKGVVEDCKATVIIAAPSCQDIANSLGLEHVMLIDEHFLLELPDPAKPIRSSSLASNAGVVLFTSGRAGKLEGTVIEHGAICSTSNAYGIDLGIGLGTRVFNFSAYTFHVGILDVLVTLIRGGCLCLPSEHARLNDLAGALNATKADWLFLTPTAANTLEPSEVPFLKFLILGGEAITNAATDRWKESSVALYATYGSAETSLAAWNPFVSDASCFFNMGRPLSGAFWVVDSEDLKKLAPIGCVGELVIQGPLLARGYINAAPEQEANWIRDALWFPKVPKLESLKAYRTGDLVRRNSDGSFDYIGRKDAQMQDIDVLKATEYWKAQLQGAQPAAFPAPLHHALQEKDMISSRAVFKSTITSPQNSDPSLTKAIVLRATWAILLARYCDTDDVTFGVTVSGRLAPFGGPEIMSSPAATSVPVRMIIDRSKSIDQFLHDCQNQATEMVAYEQFGLQNIAGLGPDAQLACDFLNLLIIQPGRHLCPETNGLTDKISFDLIDGHGDLLEDTMQSFSNYPLTLQCIMNNDSIDLLFTYDSGRLVRAELEMLSHQFQHIFSQLSSDTGGDVGSISVTSPLDTQKAMEWNKESVVPDIIEDCAHELISRQAKHYPDSPAVHAWDVSWTYAELDRLTNQISHFLVRNLGVGTEDFVHVCFEKSGWFIAAILAINKAGAAWVPIDPSQPSQRHQQVVSQTKSRLILHCSKTKDKAAGLVANAVEIGPSLMEMLKIQSYEAKSPPRIVTWKNIAYVIFTSGSTGIPKGIVMEHGALCTSLTAFTKRLGIHPRVRMLQFSSYVFDVILGEIFATLFGAGCVCVPSESSRMNNLAAYIQNNRVNWAMLTPPFLMTLNPSDVPELQTVMIGGEAAGQDIIRTWSSHVRLMTGWGPAETCFTTSSHLWLPGDTLSPKTIGRPLGSFCWIVEPDDPHRLAPIGCLGEIVIQGPMLLREYLDDPDKTASSIVSCLPDWVPQPNEGPWGRFYKTGDIGCYNSDGTIRFVSRKDTQVKIRGFRVELGEIEHHMLNLLPEVEQVSVNTVEMDNGTVLASYFSFSTQKRVLTANDGNTLNIFYPIASELQKKLAKMVSEIGKKLPQYMVPTLFLPCHFIPLTNSGKTDLKLLRKLTASLTQQDLAAYALADAEKQAPETHMELRLAQLWSTLLKIPVESIGRDDSFLQIGGDSISMIQLVSRARDEHLDISVGDMFKDPRLRSIAKKAVDMGSEAAVSVADIPPFSLLDEEQIEYVHSAEARQFCNLSSQDVIEDSYSCSKLQEGFMALSVKQKGSYVAKNVFQISAHVDLGRFKSAWETTVALVPVLRTRIITIDGVSLQFVVKDDVKWDTLFDVSLLEYLKSSHDIHMGYGSRLCRYGLAKSDAKNYFILTMHHAIHDGWTVRVIQEVLANCYRGLDVFPQQYSRFIKYTLELDVEKTKSYWLAHLQGAKRASFPPPMPQKPSDGKTATKMLTKRLAVSQSVNPSVTKATLLRATWAIILACYTDSDDVCFGESISGRQAPVPGILDIPGPAVATVPLREKLDRSQLVSSFLDDIQRHSSDSIPHEQYGLQNISKLSNDIKDACDFSSLLVVQPMQHLSPSDDSGALLVLAELNDHEGLMENYFSYSLIIQGHVYEDHINLVLIYMSDILAGTQAEALSAQFENVLRQLVEATTSVTLADISVAGEYDLKRAIEINGPRPEIIDSCIHRLIKIKALQQPHAHAIKAWDAVFTYAEFDAVADRLANFLVIEYGVQPEDLVHVCFEKSAWFFVSIIAINKAGAAWVPLEPSHPEQRQQQVVRQTRAKLALTSASNSKLCSALVPRVLEVSSTLDEKLKADETLSKQMDAATPSNIAYVLFTSGSTGTPKGLVMEHRSVCTSQIAISRRIGMSSKTRMLQFAAYVFDLAILETIAPLLAGSCVVVPSDHTRMNDLKNFIREEDINMAGFTPSLARTLDPSELPSLKLLALTGEAVSQDVFDTWYGKVTLMNGWGPAETCVWSSCHTWSSTTESPLNIGQSIGGNCFIVDAQDPMKLAPIGTVGEIIIQGPTILREYLADPVKTKEKVMDVTPSWAPNREKPYWNRCFRSGDLGFYNSEGLIEFVSRKDTQIKIHGLRVELGEIEHHLQQAMKSANRVVVDVLNLKEGTRLVSYFSYTDETRVTSSSDFNTAESPFIELDHRLKAQLLEARGHLSVSVPRYMIPSFFIPCKYMPVITSKKLDRNELRRQASALTRVELSAFSLDNSEKRAPEGEAECEMARVWSKLLDIPEDTIGRDDSFLGSGGDSITAIQLVSTLRDKGLSLTVNDVFRDPRLSAIVSSSIPSIEVNDTRTPIEPFSLVDPSIWPDPPLYEVRQQCSLSSDQQIQDILPVTKFQEGLMALAAKQPGSYIAKHVFRLPESIDTARLRKTWEETVRMCSALRTRIVLIDDVPLQVFIEGTVEWESGFDDLNMNNARIKMQTIKMTYGSPLNRSALFRTTDGQTYFAWISHHAVHDGWTMRLVLSTFQNLYRNVETPLIGQYAKFISYVSKIDQARAVEYWSKTLQGASQATFPPPVISNSTSGVVKLMKKTIDVTDTKGSSITRATVMRAAWAMVLARYSDTDDISFGTSISGRQAPVPGLLEMTGPVVTTVPVRCHLNKGKTVQDYLHTVQSQASEMVEFEQFGLQSIEKLHADARDACRFNSLLVIQPLSHLAPSEVGSSENLLTPVTEGDTTNLQNYFSYPLVTQCHLADTHTDLVLIYNSAVLSESQMEALGHHFTAAVEQLNRQDETLLGAISLSGPWDLTKALEWKGEEPEVLDACFHDIVDKHAEVNPGSAAIAAWDSSFTYSELSKASNRLANYLVEFLNIQLNEYVHVCFEKSAWYFVSILAINKAGGTWVPLDPSHPVSRLKQVVGQTKARLCLSSAGNAGLCTQLVAETLVISGLLDEKLEQHGYNGEQGPSRHVPSSTAAYVLFTSGSTGLPKGLIMEHRSLCTSQTDVYRRLRLTPKVRLLQFAAFVFDFGIGEMASTLLGGACLCIPSEHDRMNDLAGFINRFQVSWLFLTPSYAHTLIPDDVPNVEMLLLAGEAVDRDIFNTWFGKIRFVNAYGPAETCCFSTMREWQSPDESPLNIGAPVGGYCWIVEPDNHHILAPVGCIGEMAIQSPTTLRGYLSDQAKTDAVVMTDLPSWAPKRTHPRWNRFYKTGDLCYYNEHGQIIFASRKDTQVKIRGLRVELSEVEYHLRGSLQGVKQVVVDLVKTGAGSKLACFFCEGLDIRVNSGEDIFLSLSEDMQKHVIAAIGKLNVSLPRYMVPTLFVPCSYLPSITSTKIDRKRLRLLMQKLDEGQLLSYSLQDAGHSAPETEMELQLQRIWSEVLNIRQDSIGRDDNFLALGGDSIAAIKLVKVARESGVSIAVRDVFDDPRLCAVSSVAVWLDTEELKQQAAPEPFSLLGSALSPASVLETLQSQDSLSYGVEIEDAFPCTSLQEGLMALAEKQPGSYIAKNLYRLSHNIDVALFKAAWEQTVEHCANLRTRIMQVKDAIVQIVVKNDCLWEDVSDLASYRAQTKNISMGYGSRLCHYAVTRETNGTRFFVFDIHHSIYDGWTLPLIMGTLTSAYRRVSLPLLQPYTLFIKYIRDMDHNAASVYWTSYLADAGKATFPPSKDSVCPSSNSKSAMRTGVLQKMIEIPAISPSITKASLLRGAWGLVLAQYSGLDDVTFGATVSGRQAGIHGIDEMPGLVIATVPVRVRVRSSQTVGRYLQSIQTDSSKMVAYEQFGLQPISKLSPSAREACDFNSLLVIQPVDHITSTNSEAEAVLLPPESEDIQTEDLVDNYFSYPLVLQCHLLQDSIRLVFIYDMDVLPKHTMEAVGHHVEHVIHQLSELEKMIGSISAAGPWDMERFVSTNRKVDGIMDACVHDLFREQVKQRPNVPAVEGWDQTFTYSELNAAANCLSHYLVKNHDVKLDDLIPICFEKSAWFVVALLAVLKAGAAWVPMDPQHPQQRQKQIVEKTRARLVLASETTLAMCARLGPDVIIVGPILHEKLSDDDRYNLHSPAANSSPDNAAYVLFTSGSTGVPKALVMEHRSVCTSQLAIRARLNLSSQTRMLQFSAHVFDVSVGEILCTLLSGGQICIPSEDTKLNNVTSFIRDKDINTAILTPSFARTLSPDGVPKLETLVLAGEAISRDVFETWFGRVPRLFNGWGPAEACILSSVREYQSSDESALTIGYPLGSYAWLVDPNNHNRLAPTGTLGEIVIQGPTLLREYLRDPQRTEESVITKLPEWAPQREEEHWKRMYKTGDVGRYNPDGTIEFVSRKDTQVKIRGLRVELGEVEYHLQVTVPGVHQVVVDVYKSDAGSSLMAYLCFSDARELTGGSARPSSSLFLQLDQDLRRQLAATVTELNTNLPRYMIPTRFIPCSFMPVVASAKVDRKELQRLTSELDDEALTGYSLSSGLKRAPSTAHERKLQAVWAQALSRDPESVFNDDSFFDLGGDSIMAIQAVSIARDAGLLIRVQDIFKDPRLCAVAESAVTIDTAMTDESDIEPFSLLTNGQRAQMSASDIKQQCGLLPDQVIEDAFPSTPFQEGLMTLSVKQPGSYTAKYIYRLPDNVSLSRFQAAWQETVNTCTNLRTRIVLLENTAVQVIVKDDIHWELANPTSLKAAVQAMGTRKMTYGTRLCRYSLVSDTASGNKFFIWSIHHAVFDGWTTRLVLTALHQAYAGQEVTRLERYAGFIQYLQRIDQTAASEYWTKQLEGANKARFPPPLKISATGRKGNEATTQNIILTIDVPSTANPVITKATFVRAAWAIVLSKYCNTTDVTFGTSISGRQAPIRGVLDMPGPAIATVPVRIKLDRKQKALDYLQSVQNQAAEMVPFEQYGLQNLAKLSPAIQEACDFTSLLVVQPRQHLDQVGETSGGDKLLTFVEGNSDSDALDDYYSYPLIVQGHLGSDSITLTLTYHISVLSESRMNALSQQLSHVIRELIIKAGT